MVNFLPFFLKPQLLFQNIAGLLHKNGAGALALLFGTGKIVFPLSDVSQQRPALGRAEFSSKRSLSFLPQPSIRFFLGARPIKRTIIHPGNHNHGRDSTALLSQAHTAAKPPASGSKSVGENPKSSQNAFRTTWQQLFFFPAVRLFFSAFRFHSDSSLFSALSHYHATYQIRARVDGNRCTLLPQGRPHAYQKTSPTFFPILLPLRPGQLEWQKRRMFAPAPLPGNLRQLGNHSLVSRTFSIILISPSIIDIIGRRPSISPHKGGGHANTAGFFANPGCRLRNMSPHG